MRYTMHKNRNILHTCFCNLDQFKCILICCKEKNQILDIDLKGWSMLVIFFTMYDFLYSTDYFVNPLLPYSVKSSAGSTLVLYQTISVPWYYLQMIWWNVIICMYSIPEFKIRPWWYHAVTSEAWQYLLKNVSRIVKIVHSEIHLIKYKYVCMYEYCSL